MCSWKLKLASKVTPKFLEYMILTLEDLKKEDVVPQSLFNPHLAVSTDGAIQCRQFNME